VAEESKLEEFFVKAVAAAGGRAIKFRSPGNNGVPDRLVFCPDGKIRFVELKAPKRSLRKLQEKWKGVIEGYGHDHFKIDEVPQIEDFITSWGCISE